MLYDKFAQSIAELMELQEGKSHTNTAYEWHGGGGSSLYQFASTGGKVHSEEHRTALHKEIDKNIDWCNSNKHTSEAKDLPKLHSLKSHIQKANISKLSESLEQLDEANVMFPHPKTGELVSTSMKDAYKNFHKSLTAAGYDLVSTSGKHPKYKHRVTGKVVTGVNSHSGDIPMQAIRDISKALS